MELSKSQLESIRYQIKKLGETAGNDEIRKASESFQDFDAVVIAQHVINSQEFAKTALTVQNSQPVQNSQSALSVSQKQELVKIQAEFLGIELSQPEIQAIACQADSKIQDNLEFLREVQSLIKA
jgi:DNA replication protein DnaD